MLHGVIDVLAYLNSPDEMKAQGFMGIPYKIE